MGRIKTQLIKSTAVKIVEMHGSSFTKDFKENKALISKYAIVNSKKLKNSIAGYVTRLVRLKKIE
ncbi:30S ribosomal protein S17e [Candidatus Woesearchaeota archaeon]|nr:30S ribosomal protein S17e [Candidatus Woesearchaeota archaeon]